MNTFVKKELNPIGPTHQVIYVDKKKEKKNLVTLEVFIEVS